MFTVSNLLENLSNEESTETRTIEKILKLTRKNDRQNLEIALKALTKLGIIELNEQGQIKRIDKASYIEARLRCSSKGYCFAVRDDCNGEDIYIRDSFLNHAWNGDRVIVTITRDAVRRRSPEGKVHCILERVTSNVLSVLDIDDNILTANPLDERILSTIKLKDSDSKYFDQKISENLVEVQIDKYPIGQYDAEGHVIRPLPLHGGINGDIDILLTKNQLNYNSIVPKSTIKSPSSRNRKDLTNQPSLLFRSWTSDDSPPLPAIHVEPMSGGIKIWLHSPSLAERVSIGNNLDQWLFERSQAQCLGDKWNPLLNQNLKKACEFNVGEVNKAITAEIFLTAEGDIKDWEFYLSEIKPIAEIRQEHLISLQARKPKSRVIPATLKPLKDQISQIQTIIFFASRIIEIEKDNGLIELDLPIPELDNLSELSYELPGSELYEWKLPLNNTDPQSILSTFIRLSNRVWFDHISSLGLPAITIEPESIDSSILNDVAKSAIALDLKLELDEEGIPSASDLAKAFSRNNSRNVLDKLLKHSLPMPKLALYSHTNKTQPDISIDDESTKNSNRIQAPWCCPGINYYEIINQHIQVMLLKEGKTKPSARNKVNVDLGKKDSHKEIDWPILSESNISTLDKLTRDRIINHLVSQRNKSKSLRNGLISMAQSRSAEPLIGQELNAVISGVQSYGFFAEILPSMAEGLVHVSTLNDDWYEYRSRQNRLVGRKSKKMYQLGDVIKIKIVKVDILRNQIDLIVNEDEINENSTQVNKNTKKEDIGSSTTVLISEI